MASGIDTRAFSVTTSLLDKLNDRFVGTARAVDTLIQKLERAVLRKTTQPSGAGAAAKVETPSRHDEDLCRQARSRLGDLHLRVGECIYEMESKQTEPSLVRRQLCALLEEIERVEKVLKNVGPKRVDDEAQEISDEVNLLLAGLEVETPKE